MASLQLDIFVQRQPLPGDFHVAHLFGEMKHLEGVGAGGQGGAAAAGRSGDSGRATRSLGQRDFRMRLGQAGANSCDARQIKRAQPALRQSLGQRINRRDAVEMNGVSSRLG